MHANADLAVDDRPADAAPSPPKLAALLTGPEVAALLKISERTLFTLRQTGNIPHIKLGNQVRYDAADIRRWIDQIRRPATP